MLKVLFSLLFIVVTFANSAEDAYVFEVKGKFAKELRDLFKKYSKSGKIKVYKKSSKEDSIISTLFDSKKYDKDGKTLYMKKCASCHGLRGEKGAGAGSRALKDMSAEEIEESLNNYKMDNHFGGSMKALMHNVSVVLRGIDIKSIASYIKNGSTINKSIKKTTKRMSQENYLK